MYPEIADKLKLILISESAKYVNKELVKSDIRNYNCHVDGCLRNAYASGYCNAHYIRHRKGLDMLTPVRNRKNNDKCSICNKKTFSKGGWGMCQKHYKETRGKLIKDTLIEYLGGKCSCCGNKFPTPCYDFHHKDPSLKEYSICLMINIINIDDLCREVDKCELLCANCHRLKHYKQDV